MPRFRLSLSQTFLCSLLVAHDQEINSEIFNQLKIHSEEEKTFTLAETNEVLTIVAHKLIDMLDAEGAHKHLIDSHQQNYQKLSGYLEELDHLAFKLSKEGIPLVALKNGGIARGIYPCPGCCPMGDLDVLVEKRHFRRAHQILLEDGYQFEFRSPLDEAKLKVAEESGGAEYWKILPSGDKMWFELQWRPVAGRWIRPDQEPSSEELMARSISIHGTAARLLSPEDNLLQVALHTAKHSYVRAPGLRLHLDVERIVRAYPKLDWALFVQRVEELQVKTAVYFSLAIPAELFDTPIPDWVLQKLRPSRWKETVICRWLNQAGLFNPHERKFSKLGYIVFTSLMYDDFKGFWRGLFPDRNWMRERYGAVTTGRLFSAYIRRIRDLAFKRMNT